MPTATETSPPAPAAATAPSRIGPFDILGRMTGEGGAGVVTLSVRGAEGTPFVGRLGVAQCFAAPKDDEGRARLTGVLSKLVGLDHPAIAAPLHADASGKVAFVVNPPPVADATGLLPAAPLTPALVAEHLLTASEALETAHRAGFSHGDLSRRTVSLGDAGPVIGGWSLFGRGPAADQAGLAALTVDWLAGAPFSDTLGAEGDEPRERRVERLRRHLDGSTEQLVLVLARASEPVADDRYPTLTDFVASFQEAVTRSAEDLVNGGFEALSNRSPEVAALMAASAERYDAQAPGLDLLKLQLGGRSVPYAAVVMPGGAPGSPAPFAATAPSASNVMAGLDPALTAGIPPEMLALIAPPIATSTKPRNNPWMVMILGAVGLSLLLLVGMAIALFAGSN